ncbi:MAG: DUF3102 domain-containing protein [Selenomonadaceae bacterium]|nr:DUF3102 domain-containing protein [Selenomonadaceae bacterium]
METIEMTPIEETPKPTLPMLELEIKFYLQKTAENVVEIGKRLILAKEMVEHGEWQNWLENNFNLSQNSAGRFMQIANRFGDMSKRQNSALMQNLNATQLIAMLALPAGEEEKFIAEKSAEGTPVEDMTVKKLREEIKEWKARAEKAEENFKGCEVALNMKEQQWEYLGEQYETLQKTYHEESARMGRVMEEHADLLEEKEQLSDEVAELKNKLANRATVEVPPADYAQLKTENAELKSTTENLQKEIKELQERPIEVTTEYPADYESTKKQLAELKDKESKLQIKLENVNKLKTLFSTVSTFVNTVDLADAVQFLCEKDFTMFKIKMNMLESLCAKLKSYTPSN